MMTLSEGDKAAALFNPPMLVVSCRRQAREHMLSVDTYLIASHRCVLTFYSAGEPSRGS